MTVHCLDDHGFDSKQMQNFCHCQHVHIKYRLCPTP